MDYTLLPDDTLVNAGVRVGAAKLAAASRRIGKKLTIQKHEKPRWHPMLRHQSSIRGRLLVFHRSSLLSAHLMLRLVRLRCLYVSGRKASHQRGFFTLPNFSPFSPSSPNSDEQPPTQTYHERKIFPYGRIDLYNLVADVGSYPSFVPYCTGSTILERRVGQDGVVTMDAELMVGFLAFKESYVSRVTCRPYESVQAEASSSTPLFKTLQTTWRFQPASSISPHLSSGLPLHGDARNFVRVDSHSPDAGPTLVTLDIAFAFENPLHSALSANFFGKVSTLMVQAFEERCLAVYGSGTK